MVQACPTGEKESHAMKGLVQAACILTAILAVALLLSTPNAGAQQARKKKQVFYLNSYHDGYAWSDRLLEGIRDVLDQSGYAIEFQMEYMDLKKYPYDSMAPKLYELYKHKYANDHFDIVIISDNNALNFILEYGDKLFPGVPTVFCGINDYDFPRLRSLGITGVVESINAQETFELALKLHPFVKEVLVIGDTSATGNAIRAQIERAVPHFEGRLKFEFVTDFDLLQILNRGPNLSKETLVYFIPLFQDINGIYYTAEELLEIIHRSTSVPFYSNWAYLLGHGTVGGNLISGFDHGQAVARMALRILNGEDPEDIPIDDTIREEYIFDYQVFQELKLDMGLIPKNSRFINAPKPFYQLQKQVVWTIVVFLVALMGILAMLIRNIIRRKMVERKIKHQLTFLETLLDAIPMFISWKDAKLRYNGLNRSFMDFFGIRSHLEVLMHTDAEMGMDPEYTRQTIQLEREVMQSNAAVLRHKITVIQESGEQIWLQMNIAPLRDEKGEVVGTLSTAENISREISLERQLLQSQKMEAIGTLAGGLAHDFNNILTSIINSAELVLMDMDEDSPAYRDLERVLRAADRGSGVVRQILTFSRPSTEGFVVTRIAETVVEAVNLVERSLPRNIVIKRYIETEDTLVYADPSQIHQVVMNLCTNSYQALRSSGGEISVNLHEHEITPDLASLLELTPGPYLLLSISDNGPGIPAEIQDKVFDPFFSTKEKGEGTGLGLAVVHGIIRSHKGAVLLQSIPWSDTRMNIYLPIRPGIFACVGDHVGSVSAGKGRLLFVEDDEDQLETTPRVLESLGYIVRSCRAPEEAIRLLGDKDEAFDCIITDYDMPGTNGLELTKKAAELRPDLPVIVVSGRKSVLEPAADMSNISSVLLKPYNKSKISEAIRNALY